MKTAMFKDEKDATKYGVTCSDTGEVKAEELREGISYVTVIFPCVEINGVPKSLFDIEDLGD